MLHHTRPLRLAMTVALCTAPVLALADCRSVSGTIDAQVVSTEPVTVIGNVGGDLSGVTRAVVSGQSQNADGTVALSLGHDFVTDGRASLKTEDSATWTTIPGHEGVFHMATDYTITGGTGSLDGASGSLRNEGIADTNTGQLTLTYSGEVCTG